MHALRCLKCSYKNLRRCNACIVRILVWKAVERPHVVLNRENTFNVAVECYKHEISESIITRLTKIIMVPYPPTEEIVSKSKRFVRLLTSSFALG